MAATWMSSGLRRRVRVGLVGGGVVGGGVVDLLNRQAPLFHHLGVDFVLKAIAVKDVTKKRDFNIPASAVVTADAVAVAADPDIDMVVEVMGGCTTAKDVVLVAAAAGKHVVTANKALLARHMVEVEDAVKAGHVHALKRGHGAPTPTVNRLGWEAAVAGGVPIVKVMHQSLLVEDVTRVWGIMNGTTNYILSAMSNEGGSYSHVLTAAQRAGYAETDPSGDVLGHDACHKLVLMMRSAHGVVAHPDIILTEGITHITAGDMAAAAGMQHSIKLIAHTHVADATSGSVYAWVSPALVPVTHGMATTGGALNRIHVTGHATGETVYAGAGAGRLPTANSVVSDMLNIALDSHPHTPFPGPLPTTTTRHTRDLHDFQSRFYIRGPAAAVTTMAGALGVGSTVRPAGQGAAGVQEAFATTPLVSLSQLHAKARHAGLTCGLTPGGKESATPAGGRVVAFPIVQG